MTKVYSKRGTNGRAEAIDLARGASGLHVAHLRRK